MWLDGAYVDAGVRALRPDYAALLIVAEGLRPHLGGHLRVVKPHPRLASAPYRSAHPSAARRCGTRRPGWWR